MKLGVEEHLNNIKEKLGEDAWRDEVRRLAKAAVKTSPKHEDFWRELTKEFDWLDFDALCTEAKSDPEADPTRLVMQAMRQQMPALKTQAQFNAFMAAFDALRLTLNATFEGDAAKAIEGRSALNMALDVAVQVTEVGNQLRDVPEAATSKAADQFKNPPVHFHEYDEQKALLTELEAVVSEANLRVWYEATKSRRDKVVSQGLRNHLIDAIRNKSLTFQRAEEASNG